MSAEKYTPWFAGNNYDVVRRGAPQYGAPVRTGIYQTTDWHGYEEPNLYYRYYNAAKKYWGPCCASIAEAVEQGTRADRYRGRPSYWRGLLK